VTFPEPPAAPPDIVSVALAIPSGARLTLVGLMYHVLHVGEGQRGDGASRLTMPLNPLMLERIIVDVAEEPAGITRLAGLAVMEKSGVGEEEVTVTDTSTLCDPLPLVPLTVTL